MRYWVAGNKPGVVFSAPAAAWVAPTDAGYLAFVAAGKAATKILCDGELAHVFWRAGLNALAAAAGVTSLGGAGGMSSGDAVAMLSALGLQIASTGTPLLDAIYPCDPQSRSNLQGLLVGYMLRGSFPGGSASFAYPDAAGATHAVTQPQLQAIGAAIEDYVAALAAWGPVFAADPSAPPPAAVATIA